MALKLIGNSEVGAHIRSNLWYLICLRHWIESSHISYFIFNSEKTFLLHACATCSELPYNISNMKYSKNFTSIYSIETIYAIKV